MTPQDVGDLLELALVAVFEMSAPMLFVGLAIGVAISLVQAATQINEVTLVFIPKMLGVGAALWLAGPWIFERVAVLMTEVTVRLGPAGGG